VSAALLLGGAGCSMEPFDSQSPWVPNQSAENRALRGAAQGGAPRTAFEAFDRGRDTGGGAGFSTSVPSPGGENPWATPFENPVVAVCYGRLLNNAEEVRATARRLCPAGARLQLIRQDSFFNDCPLLQPHRAAFRCRTETAEAEPGG
jgi:hypothetical protein